MQRTRRQLHRAASLALLAMAWLALAPALARLHAVYDPLAWVPVCTSQGLVQGQSTPDGKALPNPAEHLRLDAALGAALHAPVHALAADAAAWVAPALVHERPPAALPAAGGPVPVWAGARARAPPRA